ncbi:MAG: NAD-binding protein, partial [Isosphaeraceae bacterium]
MTQQGERAVRLGVRQGLSWAMALIAIFVSIVALGWYGFHTYDYSAGGQHSLWDDLYAAFQLFDLNFRAASSGLEVPPSLQIARFLAPAVTASAIIGAFAAIFRDRVTMKRVQWLIHDHVVVCGLGRTGALLARRLRRAGHRVVAIEEDPTNESIGECREGRVIVLQGSATDRALLRKAIKRARYLFAVAGDDETTLRVATEARDLAVFRKASPLTCFVHLVDAELAQLLFQAEIGTPQSDLIRLEYFNTSELGAPGMLATSRVFARLHDGGESRQLVLVGCGEMGRRLLLQAARGWMK